MAETVGTPSVRDGDDLGARGALERLDRELQRLGTASDTDYRIAAQIAPEVRRRSQPTHLEPNFSSNARTAGCRSSPAAEAAWHVWARG